MNNAAGRRQPALSRLVVAMLWMLLAAPLAQAQDVPISVPVKLDYVLLRQVMLTQLFDTPDRTRSIYQDATDCNRIVLRDPTVNSKQDNLEIQAGVAAQLGVSGFGACQPMLDWQGGIGLLGKPVIQADGKSIKIDPQGMWLVDQDGVKTTSGPLWEVANESVKGFLDGLVIDLGPNIDALAGLLEDVLPNRSAAQLQDIVKTLRLSDVRVMPDFLGVSINAVIATQPSAPAQPAAVLNEQELRDIERQWQMMDALLVGAVKHYAAATSLESLRSALLDILIDSRYRLRDALSEPSGSPTDAVRRWFIQSWQSLAPVVREIALEQDGQEHLLWFSVLSATDALAVLDQVGPGIGLDVSTNGLRRLARMINAAEAEDMLRYSEEIDPELRQLMKSVQDDVTSEPSAIHFDFSFFPRAHAAARDLNRWVADADELDAYLPVVADLLGRTAAAVLAGNHLDSGYHELYQKLVLATAWQESCWRQYQIVDKRIEPLRSGTGDVGIMQVNERVWRGFYDRQKLRWDIDYNSRAGAEILYNYLVKYAIKQGEQQRPGGFNNLARSSYSTYNGGPRQVARYRRSDVAAAHRKVDELFWAKYLQVDAGQELNVARCLGGKVPHQPTVVAKAGTASQSMATEAPMPADSAATWVLAQPSSNVTLQLAAFSSSEAARVFVGSEALPAPVMILPVRQSGERRYLVLHGSFTLRANAETVKGHYSQLQPWLRRFADLHTMLGPSL